MDPHLSQHLPFAELERRLAALTAPADEGRVELVVVRTEVNERATPPRITVTPEAGIPGDRWARGEAPRLDSQITVMRADVARLLANGQPLTLPGDNLLVALDLSLANLPAGTRLRAGTAVLEVTPHPHTGCSKFAARFGKDALKLTAHPDYRHLRLRGLHVRVIESGDIAPGDALVVMERRNSTDPPLASEVRA